MKNNKGITLIALVITVVLLLVVTLAAVYTSVNSYKLIDLQKYKTQMQAIQSGVDEFYEEFETMYNRNERKLKEISVTDKNDSSKQINLIEDQFDFLKYYIKYRWCLEKNLTYKYSATEEETVTENTDIVQFVKGLYEYSDDVSANEDYLRNCLENTPVNNEWWVNDPNDPNDDVAEAILDISTYDDEIKSQYYFLTKNQIEELLGVKDINISENFIINFEKRYVFSEDYIKVEDKNDPGVEKKIYCLYQLDEEEKAIEFKVQNTTGYVKVEVIKKTLEYQTVKIRLLGVESTIKEVYIQSTQEGATPILVEEDKENVKEVSGLGTSEVLVKVKNNGNYYFSAKDLLDGMYSPTSEMRIKLHEPPVLENNMIPFQKVDDDKKEGIVFFDNGNNDINNWYNYGEVLYLDETKINYKKGFYPTVVLRDEIIDLDNNPINAKEDYDEADDRKVFPMKYAEKDLVVKIWIPKTLFKDINRTVRFKYIKETNFINQSGVWVGAKWDNVKKVWVPDQNYNPYTSSIEFNFDGTKIPEGDNGKTFAVNPAIEIEEEQEYYKRNIDQGVRNHKFKGSGVTLNATDNCLTFDGTGGLESLNPLKFGNNVTIEIVFSSSSFENQSSNKAVHILDARTSGAKGIQPIYVGNTKDIEVHTKSVGSGLSANYGNLTLLGRINIFQITIDNTGRLETRLNNVSLSGSNLEKITKEFESKLYIGRRYEPYAGSYNYFKGNIYAIRIHRTVLSAEELERNYNSDMKKFCRTYVDTNLELHYSGIDRGNTNNKWEDKSGRGNFGKLLGTSWGLGIGINDIEPIGNIDSSVWTGKSLAIPEASGTGTLSVITDKSVSYSGSFTMEISFKRNGGASTRGWLIDARDAGGDGFQPLYYESSGGKSKIQFWNSASNLNRDNNQDYSFYINDLEKLDDNTRKTVQLVFSRMGETNKYELKLYINGRLNYTKEINGHPRSNGGFKLNIGRRFEGYSNSNGYIYFPGEIYSVRYYNRALSEYELGVNYTLDSMNYENVNFEPTVASFSANQLNLNLSSSENLTYFYRINTQSSWTKITGNTISISESNLRNNVESISIWGETPDGKKTAVKTIRRKEVDITSYNKIKNGSFEDEFNHWGMNNATGTGHEISTQYSLYGNKSFKKPPTTPVPYNYITQYPGFILDHNYYVYVHAYNPSTTYSNVNFDIGSAGYGASNTINKDNGWTRLSLIYPSDGVNRNVAVNYTNTTVDTYIDEVGVIDLTQLQSDKSYLGIQNDLNWCNSFIESNNGKTILYYYE